MQPASGAYGDGLAKYFRPDASSHLVTTAVRKSRLAVTRIRRDTPGHGLTSPLPPERAFSVTPPHRWLLLQRVLRAKSLLRNEAFSLTDVAAACGFADQSHFTRVFTSIVGASPGAWRKQVQ